MLAVLPETCIGVGGMYLSHCSRKSWPLVQMDSHLPLLRIRVVLGPRLRLYDCLHAGRHGLKDQSKASARNDWQQVLMLMRSDQFGRLSSWWWFWGLGSLSCVSARYRQDPLKYGEWV
jgi:hypothetical protein